jgi:tetratricopeptide (TPR) repeat protein
MSDRWAECAEAAERALAHSSRAGGVPEVDAMIRYLPSTMVYGPIPVPDALRRCEEMVTTIEDDLVAWAAALKSMSVLLAMAGRFEEAREQHTRAQAVFKELGLTVRHGAGVQSGGRIELLAGDPAAAEAELRRGYDDLAALGENDYLSTVAGYLAEALYEQGRYEETAEFADICRTLAQPDDMNAQTQWPGALAKVMARRGEIAEAESLLRSALDLCAAIDNIDRHGNVLMDFAEVLTLSDRFDDAENAVNSALGFYDQKANAVSAARARKRMVELQERQSLSGRKLRFARVPDRSLATDPAARASSTSSRVPPQFLPYADPRPTNTYLRGNGVERTTYPIRARLAETAPLPAPNWSGATRANSPRSWQSVNPGDRP